MISYDSNVLIYALEGDSEFSANAQDVILAGERHGASLSVLTKQELLSGVILHEGEMDKVRDSLESLKSTRFVSVNDEVIEKSLKLTEKYGKKCYGYDAILLATAIVSGADRFYTNDHEILACNITEITVISL